MDLHYDRVLLVGDTHSNAMWWQGVVAPAAERLGVDAIVQLGDFGWWPSTREFIDLVADGNHPVWFIDGNHEHHPDLRTAASLSQARHNIDNPRTPTPLHGNLGYLPRGARFGVGKASVVCVGGARSIDRPDRTLGESYFDEELIDHADIAAATAGGHADVLLSHDAPAGWPIPGLAPDDSLPLVRRLERPKCEAHRDQLGQIYTAVTPSVVAHGHYHSHYTTTVKEQWGPVAVTGVNCDSRPHSLFTLSADSTPSVAEVYWYTRGNRS